MATDGSPVAPRLRGRLDGVAPRALEDEGVISGCVLEGSFAGQSARSLDIECSRVLRAELRASRLPWLRLVDVTLESCDLSGAFLEQAALVRVRFEDCRMSALDMSRASLRDVVFSGCRLDAANLSMSELRRVAFDDVDLRDAGLGGATLVACRLFDCDLTGADLSGARAAGTRLHGSGLEGVRGVESLRGVVIDSTQVAALGARVLDTMAIVVDDERDPTPAPSGGSPR